MTLEVIHVNQRKKLLFAEHLGRPLPLSAPSPFYSLCFLLQGWVDVPLSEQGITEATEAGKVRLSFQRPSLALSDNGKQCGASPPTLVPGRDWHQV
jgi:hypothetical protein